MIPIHNIIAFGYILMALFICGIAYIWHLEWLGIETLESYSLQIDILRKEVNDIHIQLIEFSLSGETVSDWNDNDLAQYHARRLAMDSMLCRFKAIYPAERIGSVRYLLEDKERQMRRIARQVPVIMQKSV